MLLRQMDCTYKQYQPFNMWIECDEKSVLTLCFFDIGQLANHIFNTFTVSDHRDVHMYL